MSNRVGILDQKRGSSFRQVATWVLSAVPARLFRAVRLTPFVGDVFLRAFDVVFPPPALLRKRVRKGPLEGMVLDVDPRALDMIIGRYEPGIQSILEEHLRVGDIAFDIGANLGYFTLIMAKLVAPDGHVIAFEPDPFMGAALLQNVHRNGSDVGRVTPVAAAAGASSGRAHFAHGWRATRGQLVPDGGDLEVELMALDDAAERFGTPRLLKIDVEGGELDVLVGAQKVLESKPLVVVEVHSGELERRCVALLERAGYQCERWVDRGRDEAHILAR